MSCLRNTFHYFSRFYDTLGAWGSLFSFTTIYPEVVERPFDLLDKLGTGRLTILPSAMSSGRMELRRMPHSIERQIGSERRTELSTLKRGKQEGPGVQDFAQGPSQSVNSPLVLRCGVCIIEITGFKNRPREYLLFMVF